MTNSSETKKSPTYQIHFKLLECLTIVYSIFSQAWLTLSLGHFYSMKKGGKVTKPIILVKICYKLLTYVIQVCMYVVSNIFSDFLASADIKAFGRTYLFAMLLLIGLE